MILVDVLWVVAVGGSSTLPSTIHTKHFSTLLRCGLCAWCEGRWFEGPSVWTQPSRCPTFIFLDADSTNLPVQESAPVCCVCCVTTAAARESTHARPSRRPKRCGYCSLLLLSIGIALLPLVVVAGSPQHVVRKIGITDVLIGKVTVMCLALSPRDGGEVSQHRLAIETKHV